MRQITTTLFISLIGVVAGITGCQKTAQRHAFPATWPAGLDWTQTRMAAATPAQISGPAVAVEPFMLDMETAAQPNLADPVRPWSNGASTPAS